MPHSPSNRSTRNQAGRFDGASRYAGQLLQPKRRKGWSTSNIPRPWTRAGEITEFACLTAVDPLLKTGDYE
jgi:hypothetical protein